MSELFNWTIYEADRLQGSSLGLEQSCSHVLLKFLTKNTHTEQLSMLSLLRRVLERGGMLWMSLSVRTLLLFCWIFILDQNSPKPCGQSNACLPVYCAPVTLLAFAGWRNPHCGASLSVLFILSKQPSGVQRQFRFTPNTSRECNKQPRPPPSTFTHTEHRSEGNVT